MIVVMVAIEVIVAIAVIMTRLVHTLAMVTFLP